MFIRDPVTSLDNAIATACMLAAEIGASPPLLRRRYELLRTLGRGAHGLVCEAHDRHLDRKVAVKLVPTPDARTAQNAVREARALAQFNHPNIVHIHDIDHVSEIGDYPVEVAFVVMELLEGANLRHWSAEQPGQRAIFEVLLAAGEGLAAAHEQRFVHGDFKPENVVVAGRRGVCVVDFGLARWGDDDDASRSLTQGPRGTPGYIAPEVFVARGDARSDQYAFAASLWELLLGRLPFARPGEVSPPDLEQSHANLPPLVVRVLQRAAAADPKARFPSMRELLKALHLVDTAAFVPPEPRPTPGWRQPLARVRALVARKPKESLVAKWAQRGLEVRRQAQDDVREAAGEMNDRVREPPGDDGSED